MTRAFGLFLVLFGLGWLPLLGGPRYEAALIAGLIGPSACALSAALTTTRRLSVEGTLSGVELLAIAASQGSAHAAAVLLSATIHGLLGGFCEPLYGYGLLILGPVFGIGLGAGFGVLAASTGLWFGVKSRTVLGALALTGPLSTAAFGLFEFYTTASVYFFDPFVGRFAGPLYDTVDDDLIRLSIFRLGSVCTLVGFSLIGRRAFLDSSRRTKGTRCQLTLQLGPSTALGACLLLVSFAHSWFAPELGLATTQSSLAKALPGRAHAPGCVVWFPESIGAREAERVARECAGHQAQLSRFWQTPPRDSVRVLLFDSAEQKGQLMGAHQTYVAKPWRGEIYIQKAPFPHPVLGHELAHVFSAQFGQGPFEIAGALGGLVPDPGRIEGVAVAASPPEQAEATVRQWASAMLEAERLPRVQSLFSLEFLGASAVRAYTAAGAFVEFVRERHGIAVVRAWYGGGDLEGLTTRSWDELDHDFRDYLRKTVVSAHLVALAQPRFTRPSVFERRCPHAGARMAAQSAELCMTSPRAASAFLGRAIELDGALVDSRSWLPSCEAAAGNLAEGEQLLLSTLAQAKGTSREPGLLELEGDFRWSRGDKAKAAENYGQAARFPASRDSARALALKRWALTAERELAEQVFQVTSGATVGARGPQVPDLVALALLSRDDESGVSDYLLGFHLLAVDPERSAAHLSRALERRLPVAALVLEASRRQVLSACARGAPGEAKRHLASLAELPDVPASVSSELTRVVERCTLFPEPSPHRGSE